MLSRPVSTTLQADTATTLVYIDTQGLTTTLALPAGAVTQTTTLILTPTLVQPHTGFAFAGHAFERKAFRKGRLLSGFTISKPVPVTVLCSNQDVSLVDEESQLALWWCSRGSWEAADTCDPTCAYNRGDASQVLSVSICHLSVFGLFGQTHQAYLPIVLRSCQLR